MEGKLKRLVHLAGTDPGFYVLALHAFVEYYLREEEGLRDIESFSDLTWEYRNRLMERAGGAFVDGLNSLSQLGRQHKFTNKVRHSFDELDPEEAVAATHLFTRFCLLVGLGGAAPVQELGKSLDVWQERISVLEQRATLRLMQEQLQALQRKNAQLLSTVQEYEREQARLKGLELEIAKYNLELEARKHRLEKKDERVDELRAERSRLRSEKARLLKELEKYEELERYIHALGRFSVYTKSRMDYEQSLTKLTQEQRDAVDGISLEQNFLIRGTAGTGKSLVLIEALRKAVENPELDFGNREREKIVLLTFTRTLAKFDAYLSAINRIPGVDTLIRTVDAYILHKLKLINEEWAIGYDLPAPLVSELNTLDFMTDQELTVEIESFIFGNMIGVDEYATVERIGMRRRLGHVQRRRIWEIRDEVVRRMEESGRFSKNYARLKLLAELRGRPAAGAPADRRLRDARLLFIDETQDLTAADLAVLRELTGGYMIMAGDVDQTLYGVVSPYARAGIELSGRTRLLTTNFRNTVQIQTTADRFRRLSPKGTFDLDVQPQAFREGPPPELYTAETEEALRDLLVRKLLLFHYQLGYDPDNICILAPRTHQLHTISGEVKGHGFEPVIITTPDFDFAATGTLRLSTLHSAKGLDFPVVLMYLPEIERRQAYDEESVERLLRNLVYVGLTRAMENLNVFTVPSRDPIIRDVVEAFGERSAAAPDLQ
ncbi:MAG: 3'-5' exonuclease [bacterium]